MEIAQKQVAALIKQGTFRAPRATQPNKKKGKGKGKGKGRGKAVRKEATADEQQLVAEDAQFEDEGTIWQVHSTRWEDEIGVTILYFDVERVNARLSDPSDELQDSEDLLSDDGDVCRGPPLAQQGRHLKPDPRRDSYIIVVCPP